MWTNHFSYHHIKHANIDELSREIHNHILGDYLNSNNPLIMAHDDLMTEGINFF